MQIRIFTIPIMGGEVLTQEMNQFLRSKKVLQIKENFVSNITDGSFWCFCVKYIDDVTVSDRDKNKVDYRQVLDEKTFERFSALRVIRKTIATNEGIPAYAIFTDSELAELAKLEVLDTANMRTINGIGDKKIEKYGHYFTI